MSERRVEPRTKIQIPVWMEAPSKLLPCILSNISMRGGEVLVSRDIALPTRFALRLTQDGTIRRGCNVAWREGDRVGVTFFRLSNPQSAI